MEHRTTDVRSPIPAAARVALVVVGIPVAYAAAVFLVGLTVSPHVGVDECAGIGFGCVLAPRDVVWLGGTVLGLVVVPVLWAVVAIVTWVRRRRASR